MTLYSLSDLQKIFGFTAKTTPIDADIIVMGDSTSTGNGIRKLTWANFKATLKIYTDTLYMALSGVQTIAGVKTFSSSPIAPTATAGDNTTKVATTEFAKTVSEANSVGVGQTWQDVTASRALQTTYTNSTGKPIMVFVSKTNTTNGTWQFYINGVSIGTVNAYGANNGAMIIVPNGATYMADNIAGALVKWTELR